MWTRRELKEKAKEGVKRNYGAAVLIGFVYTLVCGFIGAVGSTGSELELGAVIGSSAVITLISIFAIKPLIVSICRFSLNAVREKGDVSDLSDGFKNNYGRNVLAMFLVDLYTTLWTLLFIIPGIIKSYEYRMIPYLLTENPDMDYKEAFQTSKELMSGNKWRAFELDLSFILWYLLSVLTCGIVAVLWVEPYTLLTSAALYDEIYKERLGTEKDANE